MRARPRPATGVTLLELVLVLTIVGLLAALAQMSWAEHQRRVRRSDATIGLLRLAAAQEAYRLNTGRFAATVDRPPPDGLGLAGTEHGWYRLEILEAGVDRYLAVATPSPGSPQVRDARCQRFDIDQRGIRGASPGPAAECWR